MSNYTKLFIRNKKFEKQYGIKKEKLLSKYSYLGKIEGFGGLKW